MSEPSSGDERTRPSIPSFSGMWRKNYSDSKRIRMPTIPQWFDLLPLFLLLLLPVSAVPRSNPVVLPGENIAIGGLLPLQSYPCYALAMLYAVQDVNDATVASFPAGQAKLLPGYRVTMGFNDTLQDSAVTVAAAIWQMENRRTLALIGEVTSGVTLATATLASAFKTPLVAPQATVQDFSNKATYPYFARTVGGDDQQAYAMHSLMLHFGWKEAQILYATDGYGTAFAADLQAVASSPARNGTGVRFNAVNSFNTGDLNSIQNAITAMVADNSPIVVLLASRSADARTIASLVVRQGLLGRYQFVGCDGFFHTGTIRGTSAALKANYTAFLNGVVGTLPLIPSSPESFTLNTRIIANTLNPEDAILKQKAPTCSPSDTVTSYVYDAVLAICVAAAKVVNAGDTLSGSNVMKTMLSGLEFTGLTGQVKLNANGDRFATYSFTNYHAELQNLVSIGTWSQESTGSLTAPRGTNPYRISMTEQAVFVDGTTTPPLSYYPRAIKQIVSNATQTGLTVGSVLFAIGIGLVPLFYILKQREHVVLKTSNVPLTTLFLVGVTIGCIYPALASIPISPNSSHSVAATCVLPYLIVSIAFDIMFSALFTKTKIILSIFRNVELRILKFTWYKNFAMTALLLCIDAIVFITWSQVDMPFLELTPYQSGQMDYWQCQSHQTLTWQLLVMLPKFGMMCCLAVACYLVRDVPHAFNESRFLALILYNLIFVSSLTVLLINTVSESLASLIIGCLGVWFCLLCSVALLILPKILIIVGEWSKYSLPTVSPPVVVRAQPAIGNFVPHSKHKENAAGPSAVGEAIATRGFAAGHAAERSETPNGSFLYSAAGIGDGHEALKTISLVDSAGHDALASGGVSNLAITAPRHSAATTVSLPITMTPMTHSNCAAPSPGTANQSEGDPLLGGSGGPLTSPPNPANQPAWIPPTGYHIHYAIPSHLPRELQVDDGNSMGNASATGGSASIASVTFHQQSVSGSKPNSNEHV